MATLNLKKKTVKTENTADTKLYLCLTVKERSTVQLVYMGNEF